jgi:hypothetical protein
VSPASAPEYVIVWRESEGAALQTYAHDTNKAARVFKGTDIPEAQGTEAIDSDDEFEQLLASREPFAATRVPKQTAKKILGWTV